MAPLKRILPLSGAELIQSFAVPARIQSRVIHDTTENNKQKLEKRQNAIKNGNRILAAGYDYEISVPFICGQSKHSMDRLYKSTNQRNSGSTSTCTYSYGFSMKN